MAILSGIKRSKSDGDSPSTKAGVQRRENMNSLKGWRVEDLQLEVGASHS
jgi:hypothetical protein